LRATSTPPRVLRRGFDELGEMGESGFRSTVSTILAQVLVGLERLDEAERVLDLAAELAAPDDMDPQVRMRAVRGLLLARQGDPGGAERVAREAVEVAARTDYLVLHGEALLALADVLPPGESRAAALWSALELFESKENLVQAEQTRELLRALGEPAPAVP
jgi:hypothetical protein